MRQGKALYDGEWGLDLQRRDGFTAVMAVADPRAEEEHREDILVAEGEPSAGRARAELTHLVARQAAVALHDIPCVERAEAGLCEGYRAIQLEREVRGELIAYPAPRLEVQLPLREPFAWAEAVLHQRVVVEEREYGVEAEDLGLVAQLMTQPSAKASEADPVVHIPRGEWLVGAREARRSQLGIQRLMLGLEEEPWTDV